MIKDVAYNTGDQIPGTVQVNNIAIATSNPDYATGEWVGGVDETNAYVIVSDTTTAGLVGRTTGGGTGVASADTPTFWRSAGLTDQDLIDLINKLPGSPGDLTNVIDARDWLGASQYGLAIVNDYDTGYYYLFDTYSSADNPGEIKFPDHANGVGDLNPNNVGQSGDTLTQIYINALDSIGTDSSNDFLQLVGNSGTLTLTQGSNSVTYGFTDQAFEFSQYGNGGSYELYADNFYENSLLGSITVISPASGNFNTYDPINITYSIGSSGTSGSSGGPGWYFYSDEGNLNTSPPLSNGDAIFVNSGVETFDPNKVNGKALYFYQYDSAGVDYATQFNALQTNGGTLSITQNGQTVTYTTTNPNMFIYTPVGGGSNYSLVVNTGMLTQTASVVNPFVYGDPITLSFS
jgi:hypothetical protein